MISLFACLLLLGLVVFGPKKTIEYAQEIGRLLARLKHAAGQLQDAATAPDRPRPAISIEREGGGQK
jgi:Sec-independent protein translocase protein TatA